MATYGWVPNRKEKWRSRAQLLAEMLPQTNRILDIGANQGQILAYYRHKARQVFALDIVLSLLKEFRIENVNRVQGDAAKLPFRKDSFDCVVITECLEHIRDDENALREIARVLVPEGLLFLSVPNTERLNLKLLKLFGIPQPDHPEHFREYTLKGLKALLEKTGLHVRETTGEGILYFSRLGQLFPGWATSIIVKAQKTKE